MRRPRRHHATTFAFSAGSRDAHHLVRYTSPYLGACVAQRTKCIQEVVTTCFPKKCSFHKDFPGHPAQAVPTTTTATTTTTIIFGNSTYHWRMHASKSTKAGAARQRPRAQWMMDMQMNSKSHARQEGPTASRPTPRQRTAAPIVPQQPSRDATRESGASGQPFLPILLFRLHLHWRWSPGSANSSPRNDEVLPREA